MRIRDIDPNRWQGIADEITALCEEIAAPDGTDSWSSESLACRIYEDLNRASILATFHASFPAITMRTLRNVVPR